VESGARNIDFILTQTVLPVLSSMVLERISEQRPFNAVQMSVAADGAFSYTFFDEPLAV
jgi:type VI secretion system protein VasG